MLKQIASGYSGTPLLKKLGITATTRVALIEAPRNYFDLLGADISSQLSGIRERPDLVHLFASSKAVFHSAMKEIQGSAQSNPRIIIWVSWYKKSSGQQTDLSEDLIRSYALQHGLVDIKVCAVDGLWSGLKLVVPKSKRP